MENEITLAELQEKKEKLGSDIISAIKEFRHNAPGLKINTRSSTRVIEIADHRFKLIDEIEIEINL